MPSSELLWEHLPHSHPHARCSFSILRFSEQLDGSRVGAGPSPSQGLSAVFHVLHKWTVCGGGVAGSLTTASRVLGKHSATGLHPHTGVIVECNSCLSFFLQPTVSCFSLPGRSPLQYQCFQILVGRMNGQVEGLCSYGGTFSPWYCEMQKPGLPLTASSAFCRAQLFAGNRDQPACALVQAGEAEGFVVNTSLI